MLGQCQIRDDSGRCQGQAAHRIGVALPEDFELNGLRVHIEPRDGRLELEAEICDGHYRAIARGLWRGLSARI